MPLLIGLLIPSWAHVPFSMKLLSLPLLLLLLLSEATCSPAPVTFTLRLSKMYVLESLFVLLFVKSRSELDPNRHDGTF